MNITKEWLERCGTNSLQGFLFESGITTPQPVTLWFEQGRPEPNVFLVTDYAVPCLLKSIMEMTKQGYEFTIQTYQKGCR